MCRASAETRKDCLVEVLTIYFEVVQEAVKEEHRIGLMTATPASDDQEAQHRSKY